MLPPQQLSAVLSWLSKDGPFWDDERAHSADSWLQRDAHTLVTDTAVGEAAWKTHQGEMAELVSFKPSSWAYSPVRVTCHQELELALWHCDIPNHLELDTVRAAIQSRRAPMKTWADLQLYAMADCPHLVFSQQAFERLFSEPFAAGPAQQLLERLAVLDDLKRSCGPEGFTPQAQQRYQNHFFGDKSWFSDSSVSEKREFEKELTFWHPLKAGEKVFAPWHGKVKTPQLRIHFTFPITDSEPLLVLYVGPKITKR